MEYEEEEKEEEKAGTEDKEGKERPQKRQRAPDWWQAVLISKGIYIQLVLGSRRMSRSLFLPTRIIKFL